VTDGLAAGGGIWSLASGDDEWLLKDAMASLGRSSGLVMKLVSLQMLLSALVDAVKTMHVHLKKCSVNYLT
jgi:hypothetical protein